MMKATKIRIYPTTDQADFLNRQFGSVRFSYNAGLRIMSHRYKRHGQSLSAKHDIKKLLPVAKKSRKYNWLKEVDSIALLGCHNHKITSCSVYIIACLLPACVTYLLPEVL